MGEKILLIDGHSILNRAFYGLPDLTNKNGVHTNAVLGFLKIFFKVLDEEKPDYVFVAFDVKAKTFRHEMFAEYKGTRKPMPAELHAQVPLMQEVLTAMGIRIITAPGFEADDILGTMSRIGEDNGMEVTVLSGDRDLLQLASDKVLIRIPKTKAGGTEVENYYAADVLSKYQVTPKQFIDVKALMGDSSDNIPGVPKVGEKTATGFIVKYKSLEELYDSIDELPNNKTKENLVNNKELAFLCKELATIKRDVDLGVSLEEGRLNDIYTRSAYELCKELELKSVLTTFDRHGVSEDGAQVSTSEPKPEYIFSNATRAELLELSALAAKAALTVNLENSVVQVCFDNSPYQIYSCSFKEAAEDEEFADIPIFAALSAGGRSEDEKEELKQFITEFINKPIIKIIPEIKEILTEYKISSEEIKDKESLNDINLLEYLINPQREDYSSGLNAAEVLSGFKASYKQVEEEGMLRVYRDIEMPLTFVLSDMQQQGVMVDTNRLRNVAAALKEDIDRLNSEIIEDIGLGEFNIGSPKQLGSILFDEDKLNLMQDRKIKKTKGKTGFSTSKEVLQALSEDHPDKEHDYIRKIINYKELTKLYSTYGVGLEKYISDDGRIHTTFIQTRTATGRISSKDPNLQNIPIRTELGRQFRSVFIPREGCTFIDADYSQIELRIMAHFSEDENLIKAYKEAKDIHRYTASKAFNIPFEDVTDRERSAAKAVNFGIIYGMSSHGLSEDIGISRAEATQFIEQYFEAYPGVKIFLEGAVNKATEKGYSETLYGRRRPIPELNSSIYMQREAGKRIAMNSPIQGTAADIMKIAMINVADRLRKEGLTAKVVLQVHDELLIEAPVSEAEKVSELLKEEMERAVELKVNLDVEVKTGSDWLIAH